MSEAIASDHHARRQRAGVVLLILLPAVMIAVGGWLHRWTDEDAFINYRIVDQIFAGHGPVFNAGERVEAYTSAAWLAVLVAGRAALGWVMGPEWISVLLGLVAAVGGFATAAFAGRRVFGSDGRWVLPLGLLAVAAVPVVWDFATSGLEMGLVWLWIGGCFLALAHLTDGGAARVGVRRHASLVVIGLGPLVRPDLAVMTGTFLVAWFLLARPRRIVADLAWALTVPVAYQMFRMGYFASLVPSTALAKDSGGIHLGQGWRYLTDLIGTYALWIPLGALAVAMLVRAVRTSDRATNTVVGAVVGGGVLHAAYIVGSGGDYMHGRLLLPALFAVAAPATFGVPRRTEAGRPALLGALTAVVVVWSVVVAGAVRYPAPAKIVFGVADISDWRRLMHGSVHHHPTTSLTVPIYELRHRLDEGARGYMRLFDTTTRPGRDPHRFVLTLASIGVPGWIMGPDAFIVDIGGLAEPLAARSAPIAGRAAGHRKMVSATWYDARFGAATGNAEVRAARRALRCAPARDLLAAIDRPLTVGRFLSNVWHSVGFTTLHVPRDPRKAERAWCGRASVR